MGSVEADLIKMGLLLQGLEPERVARLQERHPSSRRQRLATVTGAEHHQVIDSLRHHRQRQQQQPQQQLFQHQQLCKEKHHPLSAWPPSHTLSQAFHGKQRKRGQSIMEQATTTTTTTTISTVAPITTTAPTATTSVSAATIKGGNKSSFSSLVATDIIDAAGRNARPVQAGYPSTPGHNGHSAFFDRDSRLYIQGVVTDESCCDDLEIQGRSASATTAAAAAATGSHHHHHHHHHHLHHPAKLHSTPRINIEECDGSSENNSTFDIVGPQAAGRFPWQRDIGVQCSILPRVRGRSRSAQGKMCSLQWDDPVDPRGQLTTAGPYRQGDLGKQTISRSEATFFMDQLLDSEDFPDREMANAAMCRSDSSVSISTIDSTGVDFSDTDTLPSLDLGRRSDTLVSPRVSPVPWLADSVPELVVTSSTDQSSKKETRQHNRSGSDGKARSNYLTVPSRRSIPRCGTVHSASDDSDSEPSPPTLRRGRRQAIFDPKSLGLVSAPDGDLSPTNSCDESESCSSPIRERPRRKRSSVDLGINYPGDLLIQGRQKKVLIKRNTIADFAATKAFQASTASLLDQDSKKYKSTFSLLKLIDKKSHRAKDKLLNLDDVLSHLKPSEFKDSHLTCYKSVHWSELIAGKEKEIDCLNLLENEIKRREAVWELFKSECVFLLDHLMVLKHCFMEPLKKVQVEGHLMFTEPQHLFGNLDELCYVSYTFCRDFISLLLKDVGVTDFGRTAVLIKALQRFCQLTRDGEVYHDYCLNYAKAMTYLEQLRSNSDFDKFEKWCEQDMRCHRLQLTDLLISPMHRCTKVPLLLNNIRHYTIDLEERSQLTGCLEKLETSLKNLEAKMKWLKNYERVQEIQQQIVWQPITELDPRAFVPEFLKSTLSKQPCERLLASPKRQLLHEGPLTLLEISKTVDMYMFLFDDILLLTRIKKPPRKVSNASHTSSVRDPPQTEGAIFVVHRQPIALDRFTIHDVRPPDGAANGLKNAFVLVQISRFQQIIGVFTLQAPSEAAKTTWLNQLKEAEDKYKEACQKKSDSSSDWPFEEDSPPKLTRKSKSLKVSRSTRSSSIRSTHSAAPGVTSSRCARAHSPSPSISSTGDSLFPFDSRDTFQRDLSLSESGTFSCGPDLISEEEEPDSVVEVLPNVATTCTGATGSSTSGDTVCIPKTTCDKLCVPGKSPSPKHHEKHYEVRQKSLPNTSGSTASPSSPSLSPSPSPASSPSLSYRETRSGSAGRASPPSITSSSDAATRALISPPHSPRSMAASARLRRLDTLKAIHEKSQSTDAIYI